MPLFKRLTDRFKDLQMLFLRVLKTGKIYQLWNAQIVRWVSFARCIINPCNSPPPTGRRSQPPGFLGAPCQSPAPQVWATLCCFYCHIPVLSVKRHILCYREAGGKLAHYLLKRCNSSHVPSKRPLTLAHWSFLRVIFNVTNCGS